MGAWAGKGVDRPGVISSNVDGAEVTCCEVPETHVLVAEAQALPGHALLLQGAELARAAGHVLASQSCESRVLRPWMSLARAYA